MRNEILRTGVGVAATALLLALLDDAVGTEADVHRFLDEARAEEATIAEVVLRNDPAMEGRIVEIYARVYGITTAEARAIAGAEFSRDRAA